PCKFFLKFFSGPSRSSNPSPSPLPVPSKHFLIPQFLIPPSSRLGVQMYDLLRSPQIFLSISNQNNPNLLIVNRISFGIYPILIKPLPNTNIVKEFFYRFF